ncbi:hypothetical protein [Mumia sp. Pv 4-285]|uniref:hypothetical protein n=1 Tax=Mumia qirimensis TaxID=3234852 RepID=UPI00351CE1D3
MSRPRPATWRTQYGALLAETPAPRRVRDVALYAVAALAFGTLTVFVLQYAGPTFFNEGPTAPIQSRRGTVPVWLPFSVGVLMAIVFGGGVLASLFSSRPKVVLARLTPDTVAILTGDTLSSLPWSDVVDVRAELVDGRELLAITVPVEGEPTTLHLVGPVETYPLMAVVHHFWRNPSDRATLGRRAGDRTAQRVLTAVAAAITIAG